MRPKWDNNKLTELTSTRKFDRLVGSRLACAITSGGTREANLYFGNLDAAKI